MSEWQIIKGDSAEVLREFDDCSNLQLWFHGTDEQAAMKIIKEGFAPGTYFSAHLEDALSYGGNHIFQVVFPAGKRSREDADGWQRCNMEPIYPKRIVAYTIHENIGLVFENSQLRQGVAERNANQVALAAKAEAAVTKPDVTQRALEIAAHVLMKYDCAPSPYMSGELLRVERDDLQGSRHEWYAWLLHQAEDGKNDTRTN